MKRIFTCAALFFLLLLGASCKNAKLPVKTLTVETASGASVEIQAEIAEKEDDRMQGFMGRKTIPDGTGMLFVYDHDLIMHFWMKNTPHPLSIAFIDHNGLIRDIFDMTPFSLANVSSTVSVRYALEVPQGYFDRAGIARGDRLHLDF